MMGRVESGGIPPDYEYGSESRPQSRRLSVMELCNDTNPDARTRTLLSTSSRPTTSSGLAASASTLTIVDRASQHTGPQLLPGTTSATAGTNAATATGTSRGGTQALGGSGVSSESISSSAAAAAAAAAPIFHNFRGAFASPPLSDASSSPRSATSPFTASHRSGIRPSPPSPDTTGPTLSRRGAGAESHHDQVRVSVASPHSPAALGMRV
jgi:C2H2 transcription facotor